MDSTARSGQPGRDSQDRTVRTGQSGQDNQDRWDRTTRTTPKTGKPQQDNHNRAARTESQYKLARTGQQGQGNQDRTTRTGQPGKDNKNRIATIGQEGAATDANNKLKIRQGTDIAIKSFSDDRCPAAYEALQRCTGRADWMYAYPSRNFTHIFVAMLNSCI